MPFSNVRERDVAEKVLRILQSEKYKLKNYLFLQPFDINQTPGYIDIVGSEPIDLQTITQNFDSYNETTFWIDLSNVFYNAIKYHNNKDSKWIAQMATSMLKYMNKERKKAESNINNADNDNNNNDNNNNNNDETDNNITSATDGITTTTTTKKKKKSKLKIKLKSESNNNNNNNNNSTPSSPVSGTTTPTTTTDNTSGGGAGKSSSQQQQQPKMMMKKMKRQKSSSSSIGGGVVNDDDDDDDENNESSSERQQQLQPPLKKPKLTLKLGTASSTNSTTTVESGQKQKQQSDGQSQSQQQPKLKLKLSLGNKPKLSSGDAGSIASITSSIDMNTTSTTTTNITANKKKKKQKQQQQQLFDSDNNNDETIATSYTSGEKKSSNSNKEKIIKKESNLSIDTKLHNKKHKESIDSIGGGNSSSHNENKKIKIKSEVTENTNANTSKKNSEVLMTKKKEKDGTSSSSNKISVKLHANNRGKELPKGVQQQEQQHAGATASGAEQQQQQSSGIVGVGSATPKATPTSTSTTTTTSATTNKKKSKFNLKKSGSNISATNSTTSKKQQQLQSDNTNVGDKITKTLPLSGGSGGDKGSSKSGTAAAASSSSTNTPPAEQALIDLSIKQCYKVLSGLRTRQQKNVKWFATPITDKKILPEYLAKIKYPMDIQTLQSNLDKGLYHGNVSGFCLDIRRIFGNALIFNVAMKDSLRPVAIEMMQTTEDLLRTFLHVDKIGSTNPAYTAPPVLYCWKLCIDILNIVYRLEGSDNQQLALYFFYPVTYYCMGDYPPGYLNKVKKPMDFGTLTGNLIEGHYQTVDAFSNDCRLVISNCLTYYEGNPEGKSFIEQANKLNVCLSQQLDQLARYDKSPKAASERQKVKEPHQLPKPSPFWLLDILKELRGQKYTDKATKLTQPLMAAFEEPVSLTTFPDYTQYVKERMDLQTIERKVKAGGYETSEDFESDVNLLFSNFEAYNSRRNAQHAVTMAKFAARKFRQIFMQRARSLDDPGSIQGSRLERQSSIVSKQQSEAQVDKLSTSGSPSSGKNEKLDASNNNFAKKKPAPRISISAVNSSVPTPSPSPGATNRVKSPAPKKLPTPAPAPVPTATIPKPKGKPDQPVPLHIAIARVKEGFPIRRAVKTLQSWEADCAKYFKELMKHPWISAQRPKFIFHVPVPDLFPDLRDSYAAKIKYPMDLTTIECSLLAGSKYSGPEEFVKDIALVFANAIRFNKDGRDIGDPLSCAYYDASIHLLRYSRWLSFEVLSEYVQDSNHVENASADGLPPISWALTSGNRQKAREEMEILALKEPIDVSLEGDRYTWYECECEKLLKVLRHQADLKYMTFFIAPNYPHDYAAFISKPIDWEKVNRTLKKRQYRTFGDFIDDLRLIFSNALKYNARHKGTDSVSGRAYEAAIFMSAKLEAAINKMILTVSDRLERERIDHANAEREIEAAERAEEAQIRAAWKKEPSSQEESSNVPSASANVSQKIRNVRRIPTQQNQDFEIPFFDEEDDGQHESSYFEFVKFQKAMFEKQRQELLSRRKISKAIGLDVITRHIQHNMAKQYFMATRQTQNKADIALTNPGEKAASELEKGKGEDTDSVEPTSVVKGSSVLGELERQDRGPLKLQLNFQKKKRGLKRKMPLFDFE